MKKNIIIKKTFKLLFSAGCILIIFSLFACTAGGSSSMTKFETISKGIYSKQIEKAYFIIKDKESFNELLDKINSDTEIIDTDINFSEEMVVGVFLGEKQTGGYEVEVTDVLDQNDYIEFQIKINEPDPGEIVAQSITSPYHIIKLNKTEKEMVFNIIEQE